MRKAFRLGLVLLMLLGGSGTAWALEEFRTVVLQNAAGATGNGTAIDTPNYTSIALQVVISNTATVTFEGTVDGTNYVSAVCTSTASTSATLVTTATASGMYQCPVAGLAKFRARVSAWTSGTVTVTARVTTAVLGKKGGGSGGTGASVSDHFVTTTDDTGDIANSFNLGGLTTGILKHSVSAGVSTPATAAAGTDYISPAGVETFATGTKTVTSKFDFGGGTLEIPNSTTLPATCVVGEAYMDTDATSGQRFYMCQSANTWALQGDGGSGGTNALLDGTAHTDTLAGTVVRGDIICGNSTPKWARLARGSTGQMLYIDSSGDCQWGTVDTSATTFTFTNKTIDCEATGNVCTIPKRIWLPAAGCNNATAGTIWDLPTSNPAVAVCVTGTNTQKGVLEFADSASLSAQTTYLLPTTWTGTVDARIKWVTAATSGNIVWQLATICVADAETDDPAFNTASTVTDAAKGTTLQTNDAAITTVTVTGCAAGELMHVKILRDSAHASDTLAATARLIGIELVIREAM